MRPLSIFLGLLFASPSFASSSVDTKKPPKSKRQRRILVNHWFQPKPSLVLINQRRYDDEWDRRTNHDQDSSSSSAQQATAHLYEDVLSTESSLSKSSTRTNTTTKTRESAEPKLTWRKPADPEAARLTIVQITDVYTLENFPSLKTMLLDVRHQQQSTDRVNPVVSMLTGDFLAPYLLSSVDGGQGMMEAIQQTPIDILTWGNHEADIPHETVCEHARMFAKNDGIWINSNMPSHDAMPYQVPYHIIHLQSADGRQTRKVALVAVLSNDPKLYKDQAFGGATILDPWKTLARYHAILTQPPHSCDLVLPLEHLYLHENHVTSERFGGDVFPLILSGHDHHRVDVRTANGTRIIKPGMDGIAAAVVEITWPNATASAPNIHNTFVEPSQNYPPSAQLEQTSRAAYDVLLPLRHSQLLRVLPPFRPLSSRNARGQVTTMGRLICSLMKAALNQKRRLLKETGQPLDAVILMGGNIRANQDYEADGKHDGDGDGDEPLFFSMETLMAELKADEVLGVVDIPGYVLAAGIEYTHAGDPQPGWFQYDSGIFQQGGKIIEVNGQPLEPSQNYRCLTKISDLTNGQSEPFKDYFTQHPQKLPQQNGTVYNMHAEILEFVAHCWFTKLWEATGLARNLQARYEILDRDGDGLWSADEIHWALEKLLLLSVSDKVKTLAQTIHDKSADVTGDGRVTIEDLEHLEELPYHAKIPAEWRDAFRDSTDAEGLQSPLLRQASNFLHESIDIPKELPVDLDYN